MKTMKKIFALTLALMLVFSLALTANAAAMPDKGSVTINGAAAGKTYSFYRIYDLESVGTNGGVIYITNEKWGTFGAPTYVDITDNIVAGMENFKTGTAQEFAAAAIAAQKDADVSEVATESGDFTVSGLQYGYYVMKSTLGNADQYTVFTLFNSTPREIDEKNTADIPKFDKSVHEDSAAEGAFGDSNTADVGEEITFKLTVTAAAGTDTYQIVDTLTNLEFLGVTGVTLNGATITEGFTVTPTAGGSNFTVDFTETFRKTLKDNDVIEITYKAKLTEAAIEKGVGTNEATFTYGDNVEIEDKTETKTYKITVTKTDDETGASLDGAVFVLKKGEKFYYYDETDDVVRWVDSQDAATKVISGADGVLTFAGIDADDYILVEIKAPNGYVLPTATQDVNVNETTDENGDLNVEVGITNTLGEELPETGGMGTTLFYTLGGMMVAAAAVLLVTKKRMSAM